MPVVLNERVSVPTRTKYSAGAEFFQFGQRISIDGATIPTAVSRILNKYNATMLLPGVAEPILGPELVPDSGFDNPSAWSFSQPTSGSVTVSDSSVRLNTLDGSFASAQPWPPFELEIGKTYKFEFDIASNSGSGARCDLGGIVGTPKTTVGTHSGMVTATATTRPILVRGATVATDVVVTRMSCREILGYNHTRFSYQAGNYRESTGQTIAAADQQVGLVVDAARVPGPELVPQPLDLSAAPWSSKGTVSNLSQSSFTAVGGAAGRAIAGLLDTSKTYEAVVEFTKSDATTAFQVVPTGASGFGQSTAASGTVRGIIKPGNAELYLRLEGPATVTITSISVRELPGIGATQYTSGYQPVLRRGLLNQLLWSSDFGNAAWATTGSSKVGNKLVEDTSTATHIVVRSTSGTNGEAVTLAAVIEAAGRNYAHISISGATHAATINLTNGVVNAATGYPIQISSVNLGSGKWLLSLSGAYSTVVNQCNFYTSADGVWANRSYTGDGASGIVMHSAAFFKGTVTAEEIIAAGGIPVTTSTPASSANGIQSWQFDGTDDRLSLSAVPFQMSDDHFVVAGAEVGTVGATRHLFNASGLENQRMCNIAISNTGYPTALWRDDAGTLAQVYSTVQVSAGAKVVLAAKKGGNTKSLRLNGVTVAPDNTTALGVTTVTSGNGMVGSYLNTGGGYFNGHIHGIIFGKGAISDSELLTLERFMASLQGRTL